MDEDVTLATLLRDHPEWADLPLVIYSDDGEYHFVGASGSVYVDNDEDNEDDENTPVLVFAGN